MADPTQTEVWNVLREISWMIYQDYLELVSNTQKYIDHEDDLKADAQLLDAALNASVVDAMASYRASRVAAIQRGGRAMADGALRQMARTLNIPETTPAGVLRRLRENMRDNSDTVAPIGGSFGSPTSGGSNTGNPRFFRTTVDWKGLALENARYTDTLTLECKADQMSGVPKGREVYVIRGDSKGPDIVEIDGSGFKSQIQLDSADTSLLQNSSFSQLNGTSAGSLTTIPYWEIQVGSAGNFALSTTVHRSSSIESTAYSLQWNQGTTSTIRQGLKSAGVSIRSPEEIPFQFGVWYNNQSGAAGALTLGLGSQEETFTVASGTTGWVLAVLNTGTPQNLYYPNWQQTDPYATIKYSGPAGFLTDNAYLGEQRPIGPPGRSTYGTMFAGDVDSLYDDEFTISDTRTAIASQGVLQWMFRTLYDFTLPPATSAGVATITEPS